MLALLTQQRPWILAVAGLITCYLAPVAHAQDPAAGKQPAGAKGQAKAQFVEKFLDDHPDWKGLRSKLVEKGAFENDDELKVFTAHYNWFASHLTHFSGAKRNSFNIAENGEKIADTRIKLKAEMQMFAKGQKPSTACHDALVDQLSKMLPNLFGSDKYHPVTRVNALWLYGELNSKEGDLPVVPLATAFPVLLKIYTNDTQPAYLRATALGGLSRHAEAGVTPEAGKELTAEMVKLLKAPPAGFKPEVYDFLRLRAVDILRNLALKGSSSSTPDVATTLYSLVQNKDGKTPLDLRCEAMRAMGTLDSKVIKDASVRGIAQTYAKLALEIARQAPKPEEEGVGADVVKVPAPVRPRVAPPGGNQFVAATQDADAADPPVNNAAAAAAAVPAKPAEAAAPAAQAAGLAPDVQTYMLGCVQTAFLGDAKAPTTEKEVKRGLAYSASDKNKQFVSDIYARLGDVAKVVRPKKQGDQLTPAEYAKLQEAIGKLETAVNGAPAAAKAAAE